MYCFFVWLFLAFFSSVNEITDSTSYAIANNYAILFSRVEINTWKAAQELRLILAEMGLRLQDEHKAAQAVTYGPKKISLPTDKTWKSLASFTISFKALMTCGELLSNRYVFHEQVYCKKPLPQFCYVVTRKWWNHKLTYNHYFIFNFY